MERFPQYLHMPYRILWFETDEVALLAGGYLVGNFITFKLLLALPVLFVLYRRQKRKRPRGFFKHLGYYLGFINFKHYPQAYIPRFGE